MTEEHKRKIGLANSISLKGIKRGSMDVETKRKLSEGRLGDENWSKRPEVREKMRKAKLGKKNELANHWKGDDVGYSGLHTWVQRTLGKPDTCEHCKTSGLKGREIHWANKSGNYKRDKEDWLRLCASCHLTYDWPKRRNYISKK